MTIVMRVSGGDLLYWISNSIVIFYVPPIETTPQGDPA
jgi:hypothetical protein